MPIRAMRLLPLLPLLPLLTATLCPCLPAQRHLVLRPQDPLLLDYFMVQPREEPKGWLDAERYLVFEAGPAAVPGGDDPPRWQAVAARTGQRTPWLDRAALRERLQGAKLPAGALAATDDASAYTWTTDHERFVLSVAGDLFAADRGLTAWQRLTTTDATEEIVQISPDGQQVSFVRHGDLHVMPFGGGVARQLTEGGGEKLLHGKLDWVYQEEVYGRGEWQAHWWSPDSKRIALLRIDERAVKPFTLVPHAPFRPEPEVTPYPKVGEPNPVASLGIVDLAGSAVRWVDLPDHRDHEHLIVRVTWSPDSARCLFQVQDRAQTWLDLLAADATTGALTKLFRETSDCWVEPKAVPEWTADGSGFLWLSERDGYRHIYRYAADGTLQGRLTEGPFEVKEIVAVDASAGRCWFLADRQDCKGVHLFTVPLQGGELQQVTSGDGTHDVDMAPGNGSFLSRWSSLRSPEAISVCASDGALLRAVAAPRLELLARYGLPAPRFVQIPCRDGFVMEGLLLLPKGAAEQPKLPTLMAIYAGPHTPRVRDAWGGRDYLWHQMLAQKGVATLVVDNRSASGKGRQAAKACFGALGGSELRDLEDAAGWLAEQGFADPARLGVWGWSYGGYQTLYNLTHSQRWKLGIAVNAVTDWRLYDTIYTERYHGLLPGNEAAYDRSSVVQAAGNLHGELLLVAAALDDNVHMQNSLMFLEALQKAQKQCRFMVYPGVRHGIETLEQQVHLITLMTDFVLEKL